MGDTGVHLQKWDGYGERVLQPDLYQQWGSRINICRCLLLQRGQVQPGRARDADPTEAPGPDNTTPCPECVKCYSCGYMKNGDSETGPLGGDVPFCNDFANADDNLANCGKDDCCGMLKEYFIKIDEATGENSTQIVGRHGCAADMEHLSHYSATCKENGESCWQVDDAQLDHDPIPEVPTTTAAPGSASQATLALLLLFSPLL